ncbi:MAG TPA: hypothetical protein VJH97_03285 [Candidatus Nanoarchaeia archaeon]|nr:hypothetical protein [Candidatus Nanoarchaeia archaeon]
MDIEKFLAAAKSSRHLEEKIFLVYFLAISFELSELLVSTTIISST